MFALLVLLLTFHGITEASTVTLTKPGYSVYFPWPVSGRIRISATCSTSLDLKNSHVRLLILRDGTHGGAIIWYPDKSEILIWFKGFETQKLPFTPDCSGGGKITYTVQFTTEEIQVMYEGNVLGAIHKWLRLDRLRWIDFM